jgi:hypothetical protein
MVVVGELGVVIVAVPGFEDKADHVPTPIPAIVAESVVKQTTVWSIPASGLELTVTVPVPVPEQLNNV